MKALICYNPYSGKQSFEKDLDYIIYRLKSKYSEVNVFRSVASKSITTFIKNFASGYDLLLVSGGDGTLNEAVNGLMQCELKPKLAYIPNGTVNDVGHMFKLKDSINKTMDVILISKSAKMDICKMNNRYFVYACACGSFTNVSYKANSKYKKRLGKLAYFLEASKDIISDETLDLTISTENETISGSYYVMIALNSMRVAGFKIHRHISPKLDDGLIDLSLISKSRYKTSIFRLINFFIFGENVNKGIKNIRTSKFTISSDKEIPYNLDGEYAFSTSEITVEVVPRAIDFIINSKVRRKYFN